MADAKISALPALVAPAGSDLIPVVQGGVTKQVTAAQLLGPITLDHANGRVGVGSGAAAPTGLLDLQSSTALSSEAFYLSASTTGANGMAAYPVLTGTGSLNQGWRFIPAFEPAAGGFGSVYGLNFRADARNSSENIAQIFGIRAGLRTEASFTGAVTNVTALEIGSPSFLGSAPSGLVSGLLVNAQSGGASNFAINTLGGDHRFSGDTYPGADNSYTLGAASARWSEVYAATGTINTSDERLKREVAELPGETALAFLEGLQPITYKERDSGRFDDQGQPLPGQRLHMGLSAQQVEARALALGIDFAGFTKTPAKPQLVLDGYDQPDETEGGDPVPRWRQEDPEFAEVYGLRYHEFIAPLIGAVKTLAARAAALEARIAELEAA